jgi:single-strand DNA-binding protein
MLNDITIMGRLTKPIEKKTTPSGVSVINNTVAVDRDRKNGDEKLTDFIDCVFWRFNADFLEKYADKGRMVVVHGRLESRKWQDKDGNNRISWEIQADNVYLADSKRDSNTSSQTATTGDFVMIEDSDAEMPF